MRTLFLASIIFASFVSTSAFAVDKELADLNQTTFDSVDANHDGRASLREIELFQDLVMLSMDSDDDGVVSLKEYLVWDMGWDELAKSRNKLVEYQTARESIFKTWDRNNDGMLSLEEQKLSPERDFHVGQQDLAKPLNLKQFMSRLRIILAMNEAVTEGEHVTLINAFIVPVGKEAEAVRFWDKAADFMRGQPGYVSTALHQSILPDAKYMLINVAQWESVDAFKAASKALRTESGIKPLEGLVPNPSLYKVIRAD